MLVDNFARDDPVGGATRWEIQTVRVQDLRLLEV